MLKRYDKVLITSVDAFVNRKNCPDTSLITGIVINYRKQYESHTKFAELSSNLQNKEADIVKKLEQSLIDNAPVNLVIRTNEKNPERFDRVEKIEFTLT